MCGELSPVALRAGSAIVAVVDGSAHDVADHWETHAAEWVAWTRAPGHDAFWSYREAFRAFVPTPGALTVEVGCGEGRISRELRTLGHRVVAVELAPSMLVSAREAGSADGYVRGDVERLPLRDAVADRVVAYNVLMDVADMPGALAEIARVLRPDGIVTVSVVHPLADHGRFVGREPDASFVIEGSWFDRGHFTASEERDGLSMHFAGWRHTLGDYVCAVRDAGLAIVDLVEPVPDAAARRRGNGWWDRIPMFCWLTLEHARSRSSSCRSAPRPAPGN
jgi:SAM-dependent methyltransferase